MGMSYTILFFEFMDNIQFDKSYIYIYIYIKYKGYIYKNIIYICLKYKGYI
jgi:hypothetical protein